MNIKPWVGFLLLFAIVCVPLFAHLDELNIQKWDEARQATNALEMRMNGNLLVTHFNGHPELYNTKPPLLIWMQVLCMYLFGIGELAVRIPSATAALGTCTMLYWMLGIKLGERWLGLISSFVLITSLGFVSTHASRTGDYDSLLSLLTLSYTVFYFLYLQEQERKYLVLTFVLLTLAVFTKGIAAMILLPGLLVYTLYRKMLLVVLKEKLFYLCAIAMCALIATYYTLAEMHNPGYLQAVWYWELGGRFNTVLETHGGDWLYYINVFKMVFMPWLWLVIPGAVCAWFVKNERLKQFGIYTSIVAALFLFVISRSLTKEPWYAMPVYSFMSILAGLSIYTVFKALYRIKWKIPERLNPMPYLLLMAIFYLPYKAIVKSVLNIPQPDWWAVGVEDMGQLMRNVLHDEVNIDGATLIKCDTNQQNLFWYSKALLAVGKPLKFVNADTFSAPGKYVVYTPETKTYIEEQFEHTVTEKYNSVFIYEVKGRKSAADTLKAN